MRATDFFCQASWEWPTDFQEALENHICSSDVASEQMLHSIAMVLGKSLKILKHFARGKLNLLTKNKWTEPKIFKNQSQMKKVMIYFLNQKHLKIWWDILFKKKSSKWPL
jgi:hypothetical protein